MRLHRTLHPSGVEILVEPMEHLRSCAVGVWVKRGSCHEGAAEEGLAHFIEHAVFKGTAAFPDPESLSAATDRLGGSLDAFTGKEVACFYGRVLEEQLPDLLHLLGELVSTPRFDRTELERERSVILEEIAQSEDTPDDWVSELFYQRFWEGTPLAHPILGRPEQVGGYTDEDARRFHGQTYCGGNLMVTAAGAVDPARLLGLLEPVLARLPVHGSTPVAALAPPRSFLLNVPRKGLQQANLLLGFPGPGHTAPERGAFSLLAHVLGGGMSSRLFLELRERRGLCYQVSAYPTPYRDAGALQIAASCAPANARELVRRALAECRSLAEKGLPEEELERARLQARTSLVFSQESSSSRMFTLAHQAIHFGRVQSLDEQMAEIQEVTPACVQRAAQRWLDTSALGLVNLGARRGSEIRDQDLAA